MSDRKAVSGKLRKGGNMTTAAAECVALHNMDVWTEIARRCDLSDVASLSCVVRDMSEYAGWMSYCRGHPLRFREAFARMYKYVQSIVVGDRYVSSSRFSICKQGACASTDLILVPRSQISELIGWLTVYDNDSASFLYALFSDIDTSAVCRTIVNMDVFAQVAHLASDIGRIRSGIAHMCTLMGLSRDAYEYIARKAVIASLSLDFMHVLDTTEPVNFMSAYATARIFPLEVALTSLRQISCCCPLSCDVAYRNLASRFCQALVTVIRMLSPHLVVELDPDGVLRRAYGHPDDRCSDVMPDGLHAALHVIFRESSESNTFFTESFGLAGISAVVLRQRTARFLLRHVSPIWCEAEDTRADASTGTAQNMRVRIRRAIGNWMYVLTPDEVESIQPALFSIARAELTVRDTPCLLREYRICRLHDTEAWFEHVALGRLGSARVSLDNLIHLLKRGVLDNTQSSDLIHLFRQAIMSGTVHWNIVENCRQIPSHTMCLLIAHVRYDESESDMHRVILGDFWKAVLFVLKECPLRECALDILRAMFMHMRVLLRGRVFSLPGTWRDDLMHGIPTAVQFAADALTHDYSIRGIRTYAYYIVALGVCYDDAVRLFLQRRQQRIMTSSHTLYYILRAYDLRVTCPLSSGLGHTMVDSGHFRRPEVLRALYAQGVGSALAESVQTKLWHGFMLRGPAAQQYETVCRCAEYMTREDRRKYLSEEQLFAGFVEKSGAAGRKRNEFRQLLRRLLEI